MMAALNWRTAGVALLGGYDPSSLLHTLPEM